MKLNTVDPQGRLDVLFYQLAQTILQKIEVERGVTGLQTNLLPHVESIARRTLPKANVIPREVQSILRIFAENRRQIR